ncbi:cryptochrome/photolyase family protein [Calothrix sp. PCC 6303]|uniref:cryptochrome/photolyase family protein n=1 Tax=Calothrix sp. PCC 6303 TaxID=1170562 RepID=UPI0002A03527|nr:cryptochrome/photolyase family protein [Calothrix sp. PCC 6303]AFZ00267.1 deoxyribodipyrimidine photolyase-related protein [Calothrix sp. PCC 6303]
MATGIWVLGNQLSQQQAAIQSCSHQENTPVIFIESLQHIQKRPYHKQKLVLIWSAMRHFAEELRQQGYAVTYEVSHDFITPLKAWVKANNISEIRIMEPPDRGFLDIIAELPCKVTVIANNHFLWQKTEFQEWAKGRKSLLMEYFYREGRQKFNILMEGKKPIGGEWNYDKENRQPPKGKLNPPPPKHFEADDITLEVIEVVNNLEIPTYGSLTSFNWGVNRTQALEVLEYFICTNLTEFGTYQDAMVTGEETMWHSLISPYLNIGLLHPLEVIQAAETAYQQEKIPLNSVEGFIRQILGWREYMHGLYHYVEASYFQENYFEHTHPLPEFFWTGETNMNCLHQTFKQIHNTGYAHHIQRLMILSNFSLIAGFSPQEVENWFHGAFIDGYDWVMQTNVIGMGLFADGGILASKPYASSANYINKMSDYCKNCAYNHKEKIGEKACPFNFFYWNFLHRHRNKLMKQGRMSFILKNLDKMSAEELESIQQQVDNWYH